jgi:hypothetical protein
MQKTGKFIEGDDQKGRYILFVGDVATTVVVDHGVPKVPVVEGDAPEMTAVEMAIPFPPHHLKPKPVEEIVEIRAP